MKAAIIRVLEPHANIETIYGLVILHTVDRSLVYTNS
jgi:hypothetical protein